MEDSGCSLWSSGPGLAQGLDPPQRHVTLAPSSGLRSDQHYKVRRPLFTQQASILKKTPGHGTEDTPKNTPDTSAPHTQSHMGPKAPPQTVMEPGSVQSRLKDGPLRPHSPLSAAGDRSSYVQRWSSSGLQPSYTSTSVHRGSSSVLQPSYTSTSVHRGSSSEQQPSYTSTSVHRGSSSVLQPRYTSTSVHRGSSSGLQPSYTSTSVHRGSSSGLQPSYTSTSVHRGSSSGLQPSYTSTSVHRGSSSVLQPSYTSTSVHRGSSSGLQTSYTSTSVHRGSSSGLQPSYTSTSVHRGSSSVLQPSYTSTSVHRGSSSGLQPSYTSTSVHRGSSSGLQTSYTSTSSPRRTQTNPELNSSSQYQAEYWACAVPKDPPPSLSGLDPQQDYEALLDYTYPLRPGPQGGDWTLQDSGIDLDLLSELGGEGPQKDSLPGTEGPGSLAEPVFTVDPPEWRKQKNTTVSSISAALITLPWDRGFQEDEDEEFRSLPRQIEQLQQLSLQVRELAGHLQPPLSTVHDAVEAQPRTAELLWTEDALDSVGLEQDSLLEHSRVFCGHLEQLVRWLYAASQKLEQLAPPTADILSVKSSLAQYQSFQRDVSSHVPLTSSVLQTGRLLLRCLHDTSPALRDALLLIQRQSRLLETHTEHFFSCILSAMDNVTEPQTEGLRPERRDSTKS